MKPLIMLFFISTLFAQQPFQSLEGVVGYIVLERDGKLENYAVIEGKDGSVQTIKVNSKPSVKKSDEGGQKR